MANFWENDPIVSRPIVTVPESKPLPNAMPISSATGAGPFWANDPLAGDEPPEQNAQGRYDAALEAYRALVAPQTDPQKFRQGVTERQPTIIPGISNAGPLAPYDATQLSQHGMFFGLTDEASAGMDAVGSQIGRLFSGGQGPDMGAVYAARQELEAARRDLAENRRAAGARWQK